MGKFPIFSIENFNQATGIIGNNVCKVHRLPLVIPRTIEDFQKFSLQLLKIIFSIRVDNFINRRAKGLHKVAGQIVLIELIAVDDAQLCQASVQNDLPCEGRQQQAIAVV